MLKTIKIHSAKISKIGKGAFKKIYKLPSIYLEKGLKSKYVTTIMKMLLSGGIDEITKIVQ